MLGLVESISLALKDEFKLYIPDLLPHLLTVLHADRSKDRIPTLNVLHAFAQSRLLTKAFACTAVCLDSDFHIDPTLKEHGLDEPCLNNSSALSIVL